MCDVPRMDYASLDAFNAYCCQAVLYVLICKHCTHFVYLTARRVELKPQKIRKMR